MNSPKVDELIMLLSTDWFEPYWFKIGIGVDQKTKDCLRERLRAIVRQIVGDANEYWQTNFASERLDETSRLLTKATDECSVSPATKRRIKELIDGQKRSGVDENSKWLVVSISDQLFQSSLEFDFQPDKDATEALQKLRHIISADDSSEVRFEELSMKSTSPWDVFVRDLTPDLPTKLSDFLTSIATVEAFDQLWAAINSELSASEKRELLKCYRTIAQSLTGAPLNLPDEE